MQEDWVGVAGQADSVLPDVLAWIGVALVAGLLLALMVKALWHRSRYLVVESFKDSDRQAVVAAIEEAEKRTVGEILPVVLERSDAHEGAEWLSALCTWLVGTALLAGWLPWGSPVLLLLCQLVLMATGFVLARALPDFKRRFLSERRATVVAEKQAYLEFYRHGLHDTEARTGVLIFVSFLEHRVIVMADEGINSKVPDDFWKEVDEAILEGIRSGSVSAGLVAGIARCADRLASDFPWTEGDRDEVPNRVIVRRE